MLLVLVLSLVAIGCGGGAPLTTPSASQSDSPPLRTDTIALAELYGLRLVGTSSSAQMTLPAHIEGPLWGARRCASANAGFDLRAHAGEHVVVKSQRIAQRINGLPVTLWTVEKDGVVVGAWFVVSDASMTIVGVRRGANEF